MYKESIIMILTWPALILICWVAVRIALYFYEKRQNDADTPVN